MDYELLLNTFLSIATVLGQVFTLGILVALIFRNRIPLFNTTLNFLFGERIHLALAVTFLSIVGSLGYSEVMGFDPCLLCWVQRIFIYPQFVLFSVAFAKGYHREIFDYSRILSLIGGGVALYHYYAQQVGHTLLTCGADGGVSCTEQYVFGFGYITIPMMTFTAFAFLFVLTFITERR
jgi:disulfide bond formation protein DsbB